VFLNREPTADEVVEKLNFYLSHPQELQKLQAACRPFAEKNFSEKNAEVILESYR